MTTHDMAAELLKMPPSPVVVCSGQKYSAPTLVPEMMHEEKPGVYRKAPTVDDEFNTKLVLVVRA